MSARAGIAVLVAGVLALGAVLLARGLRAALYNAPGPTVAAAASAGQPLALPLARAGDSSGRRSRLSGLAVEHGFLASYLRFLDGRLPAAGLRYASITARAQARTAGPIPRSMRDGPLLLHALAQDGVTRYSAQATATVADRQFSWPLTITLVHERDGWWVSGLVPPDLDLGRPPAHARWPRMPAVERAAAHRFARAYLKHLVGAPAPTPAMSATARRQLRLGEAALSDTRLPAHARVGAVRLRFGPLEGNEFAAAATATIARRRRSFTFLMVHTRQGWECDAFL